MPWCTAALDLLVRGVSDVESIDRTWMITMQADLGPFQKTSLVEGVRQTLEQFRALREQGQLDTADLE